MMCGIKIKQYEREIVLNIRTLLLKTEPGSAVLNIDALQSFPQLVMFVSTWNRVWRWCAYWRSGRVFLKILISPLKSLQEMNFLKTSHQVLQFMEEQIQDISHAVIIYIQLKSGCALMWQQGSFSGQEWAKWIVKCHKSAETDLMLAVQIVFMYSELSQGNYCRPHYWESCLRITADGFMFVKSKFARCPPTTYA